MAQRKCLSDSVSTLGNVCRLAGWFSPLRLLIFEEMSLPWIMQLCVWSSHELDKMLCSWSSCSALSRKKKIPALQTFVSVKGSFRFYRSALAFLFQLFIWSLNRQFDEWKRERVDKEAYKHHSLYNFANYHATVLDQLRRFNIFGMLLQGVSFIFLLLPSFLIIN